MQFSAEKHLAGISVLYSVFVVCFHFLYGGMSSGVLLALLSSSALMLAYLGLLVPKHPLIKPVLLLILGASFFVDGTSETDLILHISPFVFICGLSLGFVAAISVVALTLLLLLLVADQFFSLDKYLVVGVLGVLAAYLRWLVLKQSASLAESESTDTQFDCKTVLSLERDAEQYFNLFQRYSIGCTYLVFDVGLDEKASLKTKNELLSLAISIWNSRIRQTDQLYKISDRRFVCLLPATSKEESMVLQQDIVVAMREYEFPNRSDLRFKVSAMQCEGFEQSIDWISGIYD